MKKLIICTVNQKYC